MQNHFNAHHLSFLDNPDMAMRILEMRKKLDNSLSTEEKASKIPVIDLGLHAQDPEAWAACFVFSLARYGFAIFKNHSINENTVENTYDSIREVFKQPREVLNQYLVDKEMQRGYSGFARQKNYKTEKKNPDMKEFFQFGPNNLTLEELEAHGLHPNIWPKEVPSFKENIEQLDRSVQKAQDIILSSLGMVLVPEDKNYADNFKYGDSLWRTIYYPALNSVKDTGGIRAASHTDSCFITLLLSSNQKGLVVQPNVDDPSTWVKPETNSKYLLMNVGRILDRMTKGYLPATAHMVEKPDEISTSRISIPRFIWPNGHFEIQEYDCPSAVNGNEKSRALTQKLIEKHPVGQRVDEFKRNTLNVFKSGLKKTKVS